MFVLVFSSEYYCKQPYADDTVMAIFQISHEGF